MNLNFFSDDEDEQKLDKLLKQNCDVSTKACEVIKKSNGKIPRAVKAKKDTTQKANNPTAEKPKNITKH